MCCLPAQYILTAYSKLICDWHFALYWLQDKIVEITNSKVYFRRNSFVWIAFNFGWKHYSVLKHVDSCAGVYTGYNTLSIALALPEDGVLVACDISEEFTNIGKPFWNEVPLTARHGLHVFTDLFSENLSAALLLRKKYICVAGRSGAQNWSSHTASFANIGYFP